MPKAKISKLKLKPDSIYVDCPECGHGQKIEVGGLRKNPTTYDLDSAPKELFQEIKRKMPIECTRCPFKFKVKSRMIPYRYTVLAK